MKKCVPRLREVTQIRREGSQLDCTFATRDLSIAHATLGESACLLFLVSLFKRHINPLGFCIDESLINSVRLLAIPSLLIRARDVIAEQDSAQPRHEIPSRSKPRAVLCSLALRASQRTFLFRFSGHQRGVCLALRLFVSISHSLSSLSKCRPYQFLPRSQQLDDNQSSEPY